jgi:preprotein translocase subunit SecA
MAISQEQLVQRELNYAIVDEVDSILIDEARTPLIISGEAGESTELYYKFSNLVKRLKPEEDYNVDEKAHAVILTESGVRKSEELLGVQNLYDDVNMELSHHLNQALKAKELMKRDRDYVVKDDQIIIVDEFTGRLMFGRRYSEGLHQAIEAKENVKIQKENQTLASITFQNYFRMYNKLAGMTGTAETEEEEFRKIYSLDVVVIPTNKPMIRTDYPDVVYKTSKAKFNAVVNEIEDLYKTGRPVLVGTISIDKSEMLSDLLKKRGVPHNVLNAKYHEKEAEIIAQAGQEGAVTIATNMAGRGTDIVLGSGVADKGGLHVIGTERHESRRIDNQLRGRSGRQGDPGSSRFYVSMEDDLMRLFGADLVTGVMERLGWEEDQSIEHKYLARAIEGAQKRVEARNFDIRKHVLEYDDVLNQQREVIYSERRKVLTGADMKATIIDMIEKAVGEGLSIYADEKIYPEDWNLQELARFLKELTHTTRDLDPSELSGLRRNELREYSLDFVKEAYEKREQTVGAEQMRNMERIVLLHAVDTKWMEHLYSMDALREGISLRAYGQRDPLLEYKMEAYDMFQNMIADIQEDVVKFIFRLQLTTDGPRPTAKVRILSAQRPSAFLPEGSAHNSPDMTSPEGDVSEKIEPYRRGDEKVGRNDPCPCGSGKKYKKCCGRTS